MGYTYLTRDQWGAEYDVSQRAMMKFLPVSGIFAHHTVTVPSSDPAADMRGIERIDMSRFGVPSYSWVYHPVARVWLEGMGLHRGAHTINNANYSFNDETFGLSVIGNFNDDPFTDDNVQDYATFISWLWIQGYARGALLLRGHRDVYATACNGESFYARLPEIHDLAIELIGDHNKPTTPEVDMAAKQKYVRIQGQPQVWLASLQTPPRKVQLFADAEYEAVQEGIELLVYNKAVPGFDEIKDGSGTTRWVQPLDPKGAALFGLA